MRNEDFDQLTQRLVSARSRRGLLKCFAGGLAAVAAAAILPRAVHSQTPRRFPDPEPTESPSVHATGTPTAGPTETATSKPATTPAPVATSTPAAAATPVTAGCPVGSVLLSSGLCCPSYLACNDTCCPDNALCGSDINNAASCIANDGSDETKLQCLDNCLNKYEKFDQTCWKTCSNDYLCGAKGSAEGCSDCINTPNLCPLDTVLCAKACMGA
jgi:hypothetical protein